MSDFRFNRYKRESDTRTRNYLRSQDYLFVELSTDQKQKLERLEAEIKAKEEAKKRGKKTAEKTGIPENIATLDVVKIAMMLGLVKSKAVRDGKEPDTTFSLLDMFLGKMVKTPTYERRVVNFKNVPPSFYHSEPRILEGERLELVASRVNTECEKMTEAVKIIIEKYKEFLNTKLMFYTTEGTIESFRKEGISIMNDLIDGVIEDAEDDKERRDMLELIALVRNHLIGFIPIGKYKKLVMSHVTMMENIGMEEAEIIRYMSPLDAHLIMFPKFQFLEQNPSDRNKLILDAQMRCFTKDPRITRLNVNDFENEICVPSLAFLPVQDILQYGLIGPYNINSIGYLHSSFYILKEIKNDIRLWVVDPFLNCFIKHIRVILTDYLSATFLTFYREVFGDNVFRPEFLSSPKHKIASIFKTLLSNLLFVNSQKMDIYIREIIHRASPIIPTELDMFNGQKYADFKLPRATYHDEKTIVQSLFEPSDEGEISTFVKVYS
jgi:hypothetical protein